MFVHSSFVETKGNTILRTLDDIHRNHQSTFDDAEDVGISLEKCTQLHQVRTNDLGLGQGVEDKHLRYLMGQAIASGYFQNRKRFSEKVMDFHKHVLDDFRDGSAELLPTLADLTSQMRALGLDDVVHLASYMALRRHLQELCESVSEEESPGGILEYVLNYVNDLDTYFSCMGLCKSDWLEKLGNPVFEVVQKHRISCLFDLVIDYPDSLPALDDLKTCIKETREYALLIEDFSLAIQRRLLHPGASTADIIQHYMSTIKVLNHVEPSGYALNIISKPIQRYLRSRKDAIRNIVILLTEDSGENEGALLFANNGQHMGRFYTSDEMALDGIGRWQPAPLEIAPKNAVANSSTDTISLLTDIYGTKELFLSAYRSMLADRLIRKIDFDCSKELKTLELLKIRFGEASLHNAEIMMRDVNDSKRLNSSIQNDVLAFDDEYEDMDKLKVLVTSDQYWPSNSDFDFNLPEGLNSALDLFAKKYHSQKAPRTLKWKKSLGEVSLDLHIGGEILHFNVTPFQASILMAFQTNESMSTDGLCQKLNVPEAVLLQNVAFWLNEGVITFNKDEKQQFTRNESIIRPMATMDIEGINEDQDDNSGMEHLEPFIVGMLTNFDALPLERIHNMLKMFVSEPPYDRSIDDLGKFMNTLVHGQKVSLEGKMYKLNKE